jgi:hypothetical protein
MAKPKILPLSGIATVLGLHDIGDGDEMPVLTADPVLAWAVRVRKVKPLDQPAQHLVSLHPITPSHDGIPMPFDACSHTLGWIVVHGMLTMDMLRDQIPLLIRASFSDFCINAEERGWKYVTDDELVDTSPGALLHGSGKWVTENAMASEFMDITTAKLLKLHALVDADDWDIEEFTMSEELLRLVVH